MNESVAIDFIWFIVRAIVVFGFFIYIIFAFIVVKQVKLMTDTLELGFEKGIKLLSYFHLFLSLISFIAAIFLT